MEMKNPNQLCDPFGTLVGAVVRGNDLLAGRPIEVRAPVGDHTVGAVRRVSPAAFQNILK
jgi:hypothetical protein